MSSQAFRILVLLLAACAMTTCLSLYLTASSRKFGLEFASRGNPQLRLRHTFEAIKKSQLDAPQLDFRLVIHGGAGVVSKDIDSKPFYDSLTAIMTEAFRFAKAGKKKSGTGAITALDIVEFTVRLLEDDPLFNAGRGAVFTADGTHEMEASIMDGSNLKCGAVSLIKTVKNPISLARTVMEKTIHNYIVGEAAEKLADQQLLEKKDVSYFSTEKRKEQLLKAISIGKIVNDHDLEDTKNTKISLDPLSFQTQYPGNLSVQSSANKMENLNYIIDFKSVNSGSANTNSISENSVESVLSTAGSDVLLGDDVVEAEFPGGTGTVGCVCMFNGHVAAATSTGGLTNKMAGRIGDTPIIGAGTYANDNTCAVSATGKGEEFMRHVAAYDVSARMEIGGLSVTDAALDTVHKKLPVGSGGLIAVDSYGEYSMEFNSKGMFRGVCDSTGECSVGIWEEMIPIVVTLDDITLSPLSDKTDSVSSVDNEQPNGINV